MSKSLDNFKESIQGYLTYLISKVDQYSNGYKIDKFEIEFEENESTTLGVNWAVSNKETLTCDVIIRITLNNGQVNECKLLVPVAIDGLYVVRGNVRLNLNYLTNNNVCKITQNMMIIDGTSYIVINQRHPLDITGLYTKEFDTEIGEWVHYKVDEIDLSERSSLIGKKLKILFNLDTEPTKIDNELFRHIRKNYRLELRDNICNKDFLTTTGMFINHLRSSQYEVLSTLRSKFYKSGTIADYYIQGIINKFFNLQSISSIGIQTPNNINPITYDSLRHKVILSKGTDIGVAYSRMDESYTDFIDMVLTPDNKNVNRINELTTAIIIRDTGTVVKCYDKNFNEIEVPFYNYISSIVLTSDNVDYDTKTILDKSEYTYKLGGIRHRMKTDLSEYIELEPDRRLSRSVQMIPMLNHSDSVRGSMGSRMLGQSIEVVGCEKPIVSSGHEKVTSDLSVVAPSDGTIIAVNKGIVVLRSNEINQEGNYINYTLTKPDNLESMYGINISFSTRVKVGDVVSPGDLIFAPNSISDDSNFNYGINCNVAMLNYRGATYEDGVVISRSMARRFAHMSTIDIDFIVSPSMKIDSIKLPSDRILKSGDSLCDYQIKLDKLSSGINKTRIDLLNGQYYYKSSVIQIPLNIKEAYLVDVKYIVGDQPSEDDETIYQVENILGSSKNSVDPPVDYDYSRISLNDFQGEIPCSYRVKFRLVVVNHLTKGDKITNRFGSKGVVSLIEEDENMPRLQDGTPIDCIMNPAAVVSRKNMSQTMELYLSTFVQHIKAKCRNIINTGTMDEVRDLLKKYKFFNYLRLSDESLIELIESDTIFQFVTGTFSKVSIEEIISWFNEEGLEIGERLIDGKTGRNIRKPVVVGKMYLMKLYHLASKKSQVTVDHSVKAKFVLGMGKESQSGLKTGTMEMDALTANNLVSFIKYIDGNDTLKSSWFLSHCVLAGLGLRREDEE